MSSPRDQPPTPDYGPDERRPRSRSRSPGPRSRPTELRSTDVRSRPLGRNRSPEGGPPRSSLPRSMPTESRSTDVRSGPLGRNRSPEGGPPRNSLPGRGRSRSPERNGASFADRRQRNDSPDRRTRQRSPERATNSNTTSRPSRQRSADSLLDRQEDLPRDPKPNARSKSEDRHPDTLFSLAPMHPLDPSSVRVSQRTGPDDIRRSHSVETQNENVMYREDRSNGTMPEAHNRPIEDLSRLNVLNEQTLLAALQNAYKAGQYYTYVGDVTISINPYKPLKIYEKRYHERYNGIKLRSEQPPHVYAVADLAYQRMRKSQANQTILVSGESGAGKTEATKLMIKHIAHTCRSHVQDLHHKILAINPLLEAFGNAETKMNDNSSRFGKYIELHFNKGGALGGAQIYDYLLERSRVVQRESHGKNFHVFYYYLAGLPINMREMLGLQKPHSYRIVTNPSTWKVFTSEQDQDRCAKRFMEMEKIMIDIGLTEEDKQFIYTVLAAILHLSNIQFRETEFDYQGGVEIVNTDENEWAAKMLRVDPSELHRSLLVNIASSNTGRGGDRIESRKSQEQAEDGRDALAKALYERLFGWLVRKINIHLQPEHRPRDRRSIGILDMSGFENFKHNGFEQLLINVANEQLQYFFNENLFSQEQHDLKMGGIDWTKIKYDNNGPILDLFLGNRPERQMGLLEVLDEESRTPQATDTAMVRRFHDTFARNPHYKRTHRGDAACFDIVHYAGQVTYEVDGFLQKNRDTLSNNLVDCLLRSQDEAVAALFLASRGRTGTISRSKNPLLDDPRRGHRNREYSTDSYSSQGSLSLHTLGKKRRTVAQSFKNSLLDLKEKLSQSQPMFVRCIKPNNDKVPKRFETRLVTDQLRYNGLLELAKIRKIGFPVRFSREQFIQGYSGLSPIKPMRRPSKENCRLLLDAVGITDAEVGDEQVFLKEWHRDVLEGKLMDLNRCAAVIQKTFRGYKSREKFRTLVRTAQAEAKRKLKERLESERANSKSTLRTKTLTATSSENMSPDDNESFIETETDEGRISPDGSSPAPSSIGELSEQDKIKAELQKKKEEQSREDEKELPSYVWNFPRTIPRERISSSETFLNVLKALKIVVYFVLFFGVLGCLVLSKGSLILMTSTLNLWEIASDTVTEPDIKDVVMEGRNTIVTCLMISMIIPYCCSFVVYIFKALFGGEEWPSFVGLIQVFVLEFFQTLGLCILVFLVLPRMDMIRACVVLCACALVPAMSKIAFGRPPKFMPDHSHDWVPIGDGIKRIMWYFANVVALIIQAASLVILLFTNFETVTVENGLEYSTASMPLPGENVTSNHSGRYDILFRDVPEESNNFIRWYAPLALILLSLTWWENFIENDIKIFGNNIPLKGWKEQMHCWRQKTTFLISLWNIIIVICFPYVAFSPFKMEIHVTNYYRKSNMAVSTNMAPLLIQVFSTIGGYFMGGLACKLCMQTITFNIPLLLTTPLTMVLISCQCRYGFISTFGSPTAFWSCPEFIEPDFEFQDITNNYLWQVICGAIWWLSLMIIAGHIWWPRQHTLDGFDKLFVRPLNCNVLLENSLLLNRRRRDHEVKIKYRGNVNYNPEDRLNLIMKDHEEGIETTARINNEEDDDMIPRIYACATMWHETKNEMTQLMKSIFRMDKDQSKRRNLRQADPTFKDPDYYEWETHILFDDAMELNDDEEMVPNQFVRQFMEVIDEAGSSVHHCAITLADPIRIATPYGGRLKWVLPGGTELIIHLKDKNKIRHKKRWSQCMYMYYLLAYRLVGLKDDQIWEEDPKGQFRKETAFVPGSIFRYMPDVITQEATNTYILALDGDVDFKPDAVRLLVDMMKKNPKVGSACGRIHPVGRGPIVWFQDFEYAISHWLQKAAEHVYGCVLCSPGCFSLFRGSSLMDDNVMRTYCTKAESPAHYVQYDQGEDRWLCTLLLQQGYRVEYCAASDALTFAPETFKEFYNQRRRWGPSTMANMIDLLSSFKNTVRKNDNISYIYMLYQMMIFCSSILGPGTTLMMIAGSFNAVLGTDLWQSYVLALGPISFFVATCFTTRGDTQIIVAGILSALYAIVMMVVIIATLVNAFQESLTSPNVIFMMTLVGSFLGSGIVHPQEMMSLAHGFIYFICIPSGYLILPIYSLCNLNVVSWGTREVAQKKTKAELEQEAKDEKERLEQKSKNSRGLLAMLGLDGFFRDLKEFYGAMLGRRAESMSDIRLSRMELRMDEMKANSGKTPNELQRMLEEKKKEEQKKKANSASAAPPPVPPLRKKKKRDELINPAWLEDGHLGRGKQEHLCSEEYAFWRQLLKFHLYPLDKDKKKEMEIASELKTMRNNIVFAYLMVNFLWMVVIFQLQLLKDTLDDDFFIPIPRYDDPYGDPERFEPLGLAFLLIFGTTLTLQFSATLVHRWVTFLHIIARTEIYSHHNTVEGKLRLAEKMQAIGTVPELDEEFGLPQPDYHEEESEYQTIPPGGFRPPYRNPDHITTTNITSDSSEVGMRPRRPRPVRMDRYDYERKMRRQYNRPREFGQVPVSPDILRQNFKRRFEGLRKANPSGDFMMDMEQGGRPRNGGRNGRLPPPRNNMDHIYRTVRARHGMPPRSRRPLAPGARGGPPTRVPGMVPGMRQPPLPRPPQNNI